MTLALVVFFTSLAGIVSLFGLKEWELKRQRVIAPALRDQADAFAARLKGFLTVLKGDVEKLPPEMIHISRFVVHELALALATLLRFLSQQAHQLADLVSHKHSFRRRAPRSEFLQKVIEHKNGQAELRE